MPITVFYSGKPQIESALSEVYKNKSVAADTILEAWYYMRHETLLEIKGMFTKQELFALVDAFNGHPVQPTLETKPQFLAWEIGDMFKYKQFSQEWNVDKEKFIEKLKRLNSSQAFFLVEEISRFWDKESGGDNSLEKFVEKFLK